MAFQYKGASLTSSQEGLLEMIENSPSPFMGISKLKDLRKMMGISVVVSDRTTLVGLLNDSIKGTWDQYEKWKKEPNHLKAVLQIERTDRSSWARERLEKETPLLGLYSRTIFWFDNSAPTVYLFADNIYDYALSSGKNPDYVFGYVFIHEMMHAYYDSLNADGYPSWEPLEEAFAEFGMLTFLKMNPTLPANLMADAETDVRSKIAHGPREYGFGCELFDRTGGENPQMIHDYRRISNRIDNDVIRTWGNNYFSDIWEYQSDPSVSNAEQCFEDVIEILNYPWKEPVINIQRSVRGSSSISSGGSGPAHIMPRLRPTENWALTATKIGCDAQFPLIRRDDLIQLLVDVVKEMKNEGFEQYLSLDDDKILFIGKPFSGYTTTPPTRRYGIPESLNVKGDTVFPSFDLPIIDARKIDDILYALSVLFDGPFTLVHEDSSYVLYGPATCATRFSTASGKGKVYDIIDRSTSSFIRTESSMRAVVLFVLRDFCAKHPRVTFGDLRQWFSRFQTHLPKGLNNIELESNVKAYYGVVKDDSKNKRYFFDDPIILSSGDVILVTTRFAEDYSDVFSKAAEAMGYIIKER